MGKLSSFTFITLNGYFEGPQKGEYSWHRPGEEETDFAAKGANAGGTLVFGRVTFEHMRSFWPTPKALETMPDVAKGMNKSRKIVFSKTLKDPNWENTRVISGDLIDEVKRLKNEPGNNMTILGSGSIISHLADHNLIDEYQLMIDPVVIGNGSTLFKGLEKRLNFRLVNSHVFKSGILLLNYIPA